MSLPQHQYWLFRDSSVYIQTHRMTPTIVSDHAPTLEPPLLNEIRQTKHLYTLMYLFPTVPLKRTYHVFSLLSQFYFWFGTDFPNLYAILFIPLSIIFYNILQQKSTRKLIKISIPSKQSCKQQELLPLQLTIQHNYRLLKNLQQGFATHTSLSFHLFLPEPFCQL